MMMCVLLLFVPVLVFGGSVPVVDSEVQFLRAIGVDVFTTQLCPSSATPVDCDGAGHVTAALIYKFELSLRLNDSTLIKHSFWLLLLLLLLLFFDFVVDFFLFFVFLFFVFFFCFPFTHTQIYINSSSEWHANHGLGASIASFARGRADFQLCSYGLLFFVALLTEITQLARRGLHARESRFRWLVAVDDHDEFVWRLHSSLSL